MPTRLTIDYKMASNNHFQGYAFAALAAAAYGTNPAFAVPMYDDGMNPISVLLFRYGLCLPIIAFMALVRHRSISIKKREILPVAILGLLMAISSLTLFEAYDYMNSGVASTLLFIYPILVAVIMTIAYKERFRITTAICLVIMCIGLLELININDASNISLTGCILVFISSLTYALYLVMTNVNKTVAHISTLKLLFWQFFIGSILFIVIILCDTSLTLPTKSLGWLNLVALALLPSVISLGFTTKAIHIIGSTPTAIFGALEPVTAVLLSVFLLGQTLSTNELIGGALIVIATTLVITSDSVDRTILRMRKMFPRRHK